MNEFGYELVPVGEVAEPRQKSTRGVYQTMLEEFAASPYIAVEVRYGDRGTQAIYMGLRAAKKATAPAFDGIRIRREGASETEGRVLLEK